MASTRNPVAALAAASRAFAASAQAAPAAREASGSPPYGCERRGEIAALQRRADPRNRRLGFVAARRLVDAADAHQGAHVVEHPIPTAAFGRRRGGGDRRLDLGPVRGERGERGRARFGERLQRRERFGADAELRQGRELHRERRAGGKALLERKREHCDRSRALRDALGQRDACVALRRGAGYAFELGEAFVEPAELVEARPDGGEIVLELGETRLERARFGGRGRVRRRAIAPRRAPWRPRRARRALRRAPPWRRRRTFRAR